MIESRLEDWSGPATVDQLARSLGAEVCFFESAAADPSQVAERELQRLVARNRLIERVAGVSNATGSALIFVEDAARLPEALASGAGAILLSLAVAGAYQQAPSAAGVKQGASALGLVTRQPRLAFARAAILLRPLRTARPIHATAQVAGNVQLGLGVSIGAHAVLEGGVAVGRGTEIGAGAILGEGVVVGAMCRIYPRVVLYPGTRLGDRVVVHAGAVLGADGFGYVRDEETGAYTQFPQQGTLLIEDDVEIGANTTIDRGALDQTRISRGTKLDNLVHIGHNVQVGEDVVIAALAGISGSCTIGRGAVIAGQVGLGDHAGVGEGVILGGRAGVLPHKTVRGPGQLFWGTPAKPVKQYLRELAAVARLGRRTRAAGAIESGE
ncbi:MAG TPA: UDP-3-O-(3-hydroxymyristoyl)glucosamine N-acyltransferase [Acidobacteriaceae bacterium]